MINGNHGQGTHSTKMVADKSDKNTPNASKFIFPNCLPKPKSLESRWKKASWAFVVCLGWWLISFSKGYKKLMNRGVARAQRDGVKTTKKKLPPIFFQIPFLGHGVSNGAKWYDLP